MQRAFGNDFLSLLRIRCFQEFVTNQGKIENPEIRKFGKPEKTEYQTLDITLNEYRHQPSQSRGDIEHWLKANTA